jgi:hypothetical protein
MIGRGAAPGGLLLAACWITACGAAGPAWPGHPEDPAAGGEAGVRVSPLVPLEPRSAEAAAALQARGDAAIEDRGLVYRGSTAGLVIGRLDPADGDWTEVAVVYLPGAAVDVAVAFGAVFVSLGPAGVAVIDVADPRSPRPLALIETPGAALRLHLDGRRLAVAAGHAGVLLFDVSVPGRPALLGNWRSEGYVRQAVLHGDRIIVAEGSAGVSLLAVERDGALGHLWRTATAGEARAVAARQDRGGERLIIVADGPAGVAILAARGDEAASEDGRLALPDMARDVTLGDGPQAFVANGDRGVVTVNIARPARPEVAGTLATDKPANRLRWSGGRLLVGNDSAGLLVLDAAEPAALSPVPAAGPGN